MKQSSLSAVLLALSSVASAAIVPVSPIDGEVVALVPDAQKKVMDLATLEERIDLFRQDRERGGKVIRHDPFWRKSRPFVLTWRATEGESGPWKVEIGKDPGFEGADIRYICDKSNYPIYFHCISGADRTGSLAYVLLGALGVARHDIETDWESTFYPDIPDDINEADPEFWRRESHFTDGIATYGEEGDTWQRRCELYLRDCGITKEEIDRLREILLEPAAFGYAP